MNEFDGDGRERREGADGWRRSMLGTSAEEEKEIRWREKRKKEEEERRRKITWRREGRKVFNSWRRGERVRHHLITGPFPLHDSESCPDEVGEEG